MRPHPRRMPPSLLPVIDGATALRMTRPGFLLITVVGCLLGCAVFRLSGGSLDLWRALLTVLLALLAHAAANVFNDYHDACNGADAANAEGLFPFTGGARMIQNGEVTLAQTRQLALALSLALVCGGLWFAVSVGWPVLLLGCVGVFLAWAYSAPPLALMSRGWGELSVGAAWGLMVIGADVVQRGAFSLLPIVAAVSYGLLIANILLINGFPDAKADAQVGKRTLVVRVGPRGAAWLYVGFALTAHAWLALAVWLGWAPAAMGVGLLSFPLSGFASVALLHQARNSQRLRPAIVATIGAAVVHGVAVLAGSALAGL